KGKKKEKNKIKKHQRVNVEEEEEEEDDDDNDDSYDAVDMELLASLLLVFNPRIHISCSENIDPVILKELTDCCNEQSTKWGFLTTPQKWDYDVIPQIKVQSQPTYGDNIYDTACEAARSGHLVRLKTILKHRRVNINDIFDEHGHTPLHLAIHHKHWNIVRYCIDRGAWIDIRGGAVDASILQTPLESLIEKMESKEDSKEVTDICKQILQERTVYSRKQIEYAIDYVKDKLIDGGGISKAIDTKSYESFLQEGATFLLGVNQTDLHKILIDNNFGKEKRFDGGWFATAFLMYRIFLLFEICVQLKREGKQCIGLPTNTTASQVYEKGIKELQVQLTTYWDHITVTKLSKYPDLIEDWSCNVVKRLMSFKPKSSNNECCELSLVVGHKGHCIYLSLCKTPNLILVRIDNRWLDTVPNGISHTRKIDNNHELIQPYLAAYFPYDDSSINQNKEWLKKYIAKVTKLRNDKKKDSMEYLYCDKTCPREGISPLIVKEWPYRPIQTDANNCYLRSHNFGYRIRLGDTFYQWFRDQECKSFVFNRSHYNTALDRQKSDHGSTVKGDKNKSKGVNMSNTSSLVPDHKGLMKLLSEQLKVQYRDVRAGIAVEQSLVAMAAIQTIQKGARFRREDTCTYFDLRLDSKERSDFFQCYNSQFPNLIRKVKEISPYWVRFYFDTFVFVSEVVPSLPPYSRF
ncbi:hypothetical protein RFI_32831, partial [Reticulomyxa filosa]